LWAATNGLASLRQAEFDAPQPHADELSALAIAAVHERWNADAGFAVRPHLYDTHSLFT